MLGKPKNIRNVTQTTVEPAARVQAGRQALFALRYKPQDWPGGTPPELAAVVRQEVL